MRFFEVTIANNLDGGRSARMTTIPASAVHVAVTRALKGQKPGLNGGITIAVRELSSLPAGFCKCGHSLQAHVGGSGRCAAARCKCGGALDPQNPARERRLGKHAADYVPQPGRDDVNPGGCRVSTPEPVRREGRSCFRLEWYATEADAVLVGRIANARGEKYKGGFFDGAPVGRAPEFDTPTEFAVARGYAPAVAR